jgi:hypothetical protein
MSDTLPDGPLASFLKRQAIKKNAPTTTSMTNLQRALNAHKCPECKATSWRVLNTRDRKKTGDIGRSCICLGCSAIRMFAEKDGKVSPETNEADDLRKRLADAEAEIARLTGGNDPRLSEQAETDPTGVPNETAPAKGKPGAKSGRKKPKVEVAP